MPTLDFDAIKRIPIVEVVSGHYKIPLRYRGEYANAPCPLPSHKEGDKGRSFSVNIPGNYFRCFSESCNENSGKKGGDVINFVALMENCRERDAAQKLADWFHVGEKEKGASRMETRRTTSPHEKSYQNDSKPRDSVKGYMLEVDTWFDITFKRADGEPDDVYWKRIRNAVKSRLVESYRAGKAAVAV